MLFEFIVVCKVSCCIGMKIFNVQTKVLVHNNTFVEMKLSKTVRLKINK